MTKRQNVASLLTYARYLLRGKYKFQYFLSNIMRDTFKLDVGLHYLIWYQNTQCNAKVDDVYKKDKNKRHWWSWKIRGFDKFSDKYKIFTTKFHSLQTLFSLNTFSLTFLLKMLKILKLKWIILEILYNKISILS